MAAEQPKPIFTVGDLIEKLQEFDPTLPIRAQHAIKGGPQFIAAVGETPEEPGAIAVLYIEKPTAS